MKKQILKRNMNFITDKPKRVCCYCGLGGVLFVDCCWSFKTGEGYEKYYHKKCRKENKKC